MAYKIKGMPWNYAGSIDVSDCSSAREVIQKAGLDWDVAKAPLFAKMPINLEDEDIQNKQLDYINSHRKDNSIVGSSVFGSVSGTFGTYRTDYNIPLGVVRNKYTTVQNIDAFEFFDKAIGKDKAIYQTAGFFGNGERIFVSAKLPKNIRVNGDIVDTYLVFTNSHDGSGGVKILFTPIRVVCQNTLNAAIKHSTNIVSFRHTESVKTKIDAAAEILGITEVMTDELQKTYDYLATIKVTDEEVMNYIAANVLNDQEQYDLKQSGYTPKNVIYRSSTAIQAADISMRKVNAMGEMFDYYNNGIGQKEIIGTAWGAYNAVSGYYSNVDNAQGEKRMDSILYGDKSKKISKAAEMWL